MPLPLMSSARWKNGIGKRVGVRAGAIVSDVGKMDHACVPMQRVRRSCSCNRESRASIRAAFRT